MPTETKSFAPAAETHDARLTMPLPRRRRLLAILEPVLLSALFAVFPILHLYSQNFEESTGGIVLLYLGLAIVATAALLALAWLATRQLAGASCAVVVLTIVFLNYGRLYQVLANRRPFGMSHVGWHWVLLTMALAIVLGTTLWLRRTSRDLTTLCRFLLGIGVMLFAVSATRIVALEVRGLSRSGDRAVARMLQPLDNYRPIPPLETESAERPDVYYIILDGYARADVLKRVFDFDNSDFVAFLRSRGFYVADESCSNFPFTFLSLASSLHMCYLDELIHPKKGKPYTDRFYYLSRSPLVGRIFQSKGYRFVHFKTNFNATCRSDIADVQISLRPDWLQDEFAQVFLRTTALRLFEPSVADQHLHAFRSLLQVPSIPGPTFTFAHLIVPHNPFVFDRDGNVLQYVCQSLQFKAVASTGPQAYVEQLMFVNKKMREVINHILATSRVPPIIIVQADHGTSQTRPEGPVTPEALDKFALERLPILNAYLVPEAMRRKLYPSISPVNTFRLLLTECFGENFDPLPEKHVVGWYSDRWNLRDVTQIVHPGAERSIPLWGKREVEPAATR